jgi:acyl carrier protein
MVEEEIPMHAEELRAKIRQIVATVTNIDPALIGDETSFREELNLDSLSLLEIGVDVDYEFKLGLQDLDQRLQSVGNLRQAVELVQQVLEERSQQVEAAT